MTNPRVVILLVNWKNASDTIECLNSLEKVTYVPFDVIVVDNNSEDDSIKCLKEYCSLSKRFENYICISNLEQLKNPNISHGSKENLFILESPTNLGFASGNNLGIGFAQRNLNFSYLMLLNNDTIVHPSFLSKLVEILQSCSMIGAISPQVFYYDHPQEVQSMGGMMSMFSGRRKRIKSSQIKSSTYKVDFLNGVCILIKKRVLTTVGLLDPDYFLYVDDVDWSYRISKAGYYLLVTTEAKIWHKVSRSTGGEYNPSVIYYIVKNDILFMKKHAKFYHWPSFLVLSGFHLFNNIIINFRRNPTKSIAFLKGIFQGAKVLLLPSTIADFDITLYDFIVKSKIIFTKSELVEILGSPMESVKQSLQRLEKNKKVRIKKGAYIYPNR